MQCNLARVNGDLLYHWWA